MSDPIRKVMSLVDGNKDSIPEGDYLEICNNLKLIYATGDSAKVSRFEHVSSPVMESSGILATILGR